MKIKDFGNALSSKEMRNIKGGNMPAGTCQASPSNCPARSCSCDTKGSSTCSSSTGDASCICDGIPAKVTCND